MKKYLEITNIKEAKDEDIIDLDIVKNLKADFETILGELKDIKREADKEEDFGTSAMMDELIIGYETKLWMLGAFLKQ